MVLVRWEDMRPGDSPLGDSLVRTAESVRSGFCALRQTNPALRFLTGGSPLASPAIRRTTQAFYNSICPGTPNDVSEQRPFGGQCPVSYRVVGTVIDANNGVIGGTGTAGVIVTGPVSALWWDVRQERNVNNVLVNRWQLFARDASGLPQPRLLVGDGGGSSVQRPVNWTATLSRVDGLPDNCGDAPITIVPPTQPPAPNITIAVDVGGLSVPLNFEFGDFVFNNWPDFVFRPRFNTDLGGINITLDGIELPDFPTIENDTGDVGDTVTNTTLVQQLEQQTTNIENVLNQEITQVQDAIKIDLDKALELIRSCCCEENVTFEANTLTPVSSGNRFDLSPNVVAVVLSTVSIDRTRVRMQRGGGSTNDVYYWGWVSINYGDGSDGVRQQLAYDRQSIPCMEGATSVTVSPHFGTTFNAVEIVKNKNIPTH